MNVLIFGLGPLGLAIAKKFKAANLPIITTARHEAKRQSLQQEGYLSIAPDEIISDPKRLKTLKGLIITAPPAKDGCPAYAILHRALEAGGTNLPIWIGYASSTSVYGDAKGRWVDEGSKTIALSEEGQNRLLAESQWQGLAHSHLVQIFRLPGLYGQERNAFLRVKDEKARLISDPQQVFGRLHHDDGALGFWAGYQTQKGGVYNLCDDWPSSPNEPLIMAANILNKVLTQPQSAPHLSPKAARFYNENKRVSNARAKSVLGWRPQYPTFREGMMAILRNAIPPDQ